MAIYMCGYKTYIMTWMAIVVFYKDNFKLNLCRINHNAKTLLLYRYIWELTILNKITANDKHPFVANALKMTTIEMPFAQKLTMLNLLIGMKIAHMYMIISSLACWYCCLFFPFDVSPQLIKSVSLKAMPTSQNGMLMQCHNFIIRIVIFLPITQWEQSNGNR